MEITTDTEVEPLSTTVVTLASSLPGTPFHLLAPERLLESPTGMEIDSQSTEGPVKYISDSELDALFEDPGM